MDTIERTDLEEATGPRLRAIADQLRRLAPSRTDPHAYFQTKSDLVDELRRLALGLDQVVPKASTLPTSAKSVPKMPAPASLMLGAAPTSSTSNTDLIKC